VTYREAVAWLYGLQLYGIKLGLENMQRLCAELRIDLGPPAARDAPRSQGLQIRESSVSGAERPYFIHVAGTNGKGSVCAMLDAIYRAAGRRCGLYTSPHLVTFRERIRLDGVMISEREVADGLDRIREVVERWRHPSTFFEVTTALALGWFQDQHAHVVVLETGLGGRLDATNVVTPVVSVLTPISHDHERYLGATLPEIAVEKCGIIKSGVSVVSAPQEEMVWKVIEQVATERTAPLHRAGALEEDLKVSLPGQHQRANAALALLAVDVAACLQSFLDLPVGSALEGLCHVQWPGRFQRVRDSLVLDGAHNPAAAATLAATWREAFGERKATVILGVMRDKDARGICEALEPIVERVFAVKVGNPRSCGAAELAAVASLAMPKVIAEPKNSLREALATAQARRGLVLVTGSLFLVGETLTVLGLAEGEPERSMQ
jgi:dihydrofolate synthase / folylpolyglutamate synthase